jgi:hypothetical protein
MLKLKPGATSLYDLVNKEVLVVKKRKLKIVNSFRSAEEQLTTLAQNKEYLCKEHTVWVPTGYDCGYCHDEGISREKSFKIAKGI